MDIEAFASNRTYGNLLVVRILNYSNLRDTHLEVQKQIDLILELISSGS